jgi:hypothetical protein
MSVIDHSPCHFQVDRAKIPAQRIVPFPDSSCVFQLPVIPWLSCVIEQYRLVKVHQFPHNPSHSALNPLMTGKPSRLLKSIWSRGCKER